VSEAAKGIWNVILLVAVLMIFILWTAVLTHLALLLWQKSWGLV
jgi:hypothetical protein